MSKQKKPKKAVKVTVLKKTRKMRNPATGQMLAGGDIVDNSVMLRNKFGEVWKKDDLHEVMEMQKRLIYCKTKQYGFSYCKRGLFSVLENICRKFDRLMEESHGLPSDMEGVDKETVKSLLESMIDLGDYAGPLAMLFLKKVHPEAYEEFALRQREEYSKIVPELGLYMPTDAERRGLPGIDKTERHGRRT